MKILYIGNDPHDAEQAAFALRRFGPDVDVAWIPNLKAALGWIEENPSVAALTVELDADATAYVSFIKLVRSLGVTAPVVLVAPESAQPIPVALQVLADTTLAKDQSFLDDLPTTLKRALKDRPPLASVEASLSSEASDPPSSAAEEAPDAPRVSPFAHVVLTRDLIEERLKQAVTALEQAYLERETLAVTNVDLERRAAEAALALEQAERRRAVETREAADRLADERRHANERLSHANAALETLRVQLVEQTAGLQKAEQQAAVDRHAAAEDAARRHAKADSDLMRETSSRQAAERAAAASEAARAEEVARHTSELAALIARLADQEQQFEQRLAEAAARLDEQRRQANERSAQDAAAVDALQTKLGEATEARQQDRQQAERDRRAAAEIAATRQSALEAELIEAAAKRDALTNQLADAETRFQHGEERRRFELAAATTHLAQSEQQAAAKLAEVSAAADTRAKQAAEALESLRSELAAVRSQSSIDQKAAAEAAARSAQAAADATEREARLEAKLSEESVRRETVEHELVQARAAAEQTQRRFLDASNEMRERAREHAHHLEERAARERVEWEGTLAEHLARLQASHDEQRAGAERAQAAAQADLARVREECAALKATLDDHRRQFDAAPVSICRWAPDGSMTQASRTLAKLLGYATPEQLMTAGAAVFDAGDELRWLIDRCLSSRSAQTIETTWRKKNGSKIVVRLVAAATSAGCIDLAAEDITNVRALEEKLRHAQRLEAVARYASEVAGTCENLLKDVTHAGPQWLTRIENDAVRHDGERLFGDLIRVSGFLRKLAEYGDKQKQALPLVDVHSALQDLAPVLKRVAGDHIELVVPNESKPLNLDVEAEQVERIFVNIAAYARARMPFGGRLLVDVTPALVDREFAEKYPSVRPGAHVLLTVTEMKGPMVSNGDSVLHSSGPDADGNPGVDLGVLQSLVANCGGHLWIAAEPSGDMVLKIHLPRRVLDDRAATTLPGRLISRLAGARH